MTVTEPEWSDEDRAVLLALAIVEADICPRGHGPLAEVTSAEAASRKYNVVQSRCHICTAIDESAVAYRDNPQPQALMFHIRPG